MAFNSTCSLTGIIQTTTGNQFPSRQAYEAKKKTHRKLLKQHHKRWFHFLAHPSQARRDICKSHANFNISLRKIHVCSLWPFLVHRMQLYIAYEWLNAACNFCMQVLQLEAVFLLETTVVWSTIAGYEVNLVLKGINKIILKKKKVFCFWLLTQFSEGFRGRCTSDLEIPCVSERAWLRVSDP